MFSKPNNPPPAPPTPARPEPTALTGDPAAPRPLPRADKAASLIAHDMTLEGNITGGGELQVDGAIKGDVRVERVTIGEGGHVDGGVYAEAVEVRGRVNGSITAKQVRLHGACHVDGDITHEQLAMETGAFFQGRSLRLQRPPTQAAQPTVTPPAPRPAPTPAALAASSKDSAGLDLGPKPAAAP
jgi:cytoskeletal protein CcmA (bactofilin family)